eukprot:scaffold318354_cov14-Tisochrysis_lutea.AAC.1
MPCWDQQSSHCSEPAGATLCLVTPKISRTLSSTQLFRATKGSRRPLFKDLTHPQAAGAARPQT